MLDHLSGHHGQARLTHKISLHTLFIHFLLCSLSIDCYKWRQGMYKCYLLVLDFLHKNYKKNLLKYGFLSPNTGWYSQNLPLLIIWQIIFYLVKYENNLCFLWNTLIKKCFLLFPWIVCFGTYTIMINVLIFHCQLCPEFSRSRANNLVKDMNTIQKKIHDVLFIIVIVRNMKSSTIFTWNGLEKLTLPCVPFIYLEE